MASYVDITREDFEGWLQSMPQFRGKWSLKSGTAGIYYLHLSPFVAVSISSTVGSSGNTMGHGAASMSLRLVSRVTDRVLNKKAQTQNHFKRTMNWRTNWLKGVKAMVDAYTSNPSFYDAIAQVEDLARYKREWIGKIEGYPGWDQNDFLISLHQRVKGGGILSMKQEEALDRVLSNAPRPAPPTPGSGRQQEMVLEEDPRIEVLRALYVEANRDGDNWTRDFAKSIGMQLKDGRRPLSPKQVQILEDKIRTYGLDKHPGRGKRASLSDKVADYWDEDDRVRMAGWGRPKAPEWPEFDQLLAWIKRTFPRQGFIFEERRTWGDDNYDLIVEPKGDPTWTLIGEIRETAKGHTFALKSHSAQVVTWLPPQDKLSLQEMRQFTEKTINQYQVTRWGGPASGGKPSVSADPIKGIRDVQATFDTVDEWHYTNLEVVLELNTDHHVDEGVILDWLKRHWNEVQKRAPSKVPEPSGPPFRGDYQDDSYWRDDHPEEGLGWLNPRVMSWRDLDRTEVDQNRFQAVFTCAGGIR